MIHVLDTSAVLAHYFNEPGQIVISQLIADPNITIGISALTVYELTTRLRTAGIAVPEIQEAISIYSQTFDFVAPVTEEIALIGADLRAKASARIAAVDVMIAATATSVGATLVHRDPHFTSLPAGNPMQIMLPDKN